jgi:hypothetical protein
MTGRKKIYRLLNMCFEADVVITPAPCGDVIESEGALSEYLL